MGILIKAEEIKKQGEEQNFARRENSPIKPAIMLSIRKSNTKVKAGIFCRNLKEH